MDWIHCNECFKVPHQHRVFFFVLPCSRILCADCQLHKSCAASGKVCEKCAATGFTATKLRPDLPAEIRDYFHNSHLVLKKYLKVVDFQKGHREALHRHRTEELRRLQEECHHWRTSYEAVQATVEPMKRRIEELDVALYRLREKYESTSVPHSPQSRIREMGSQRGVKPPPLSASVPSSGGRSGSAKRKTPAVISSAEAKHVSGRQPAVTNRPAPTSERRWLLQHDTPQSIVPAFRSNVFGPVTPLARPGTSSSSTLLQHSMFSSRSISLQPRVAKPTSAYAIDRVYSIMSSAIDKLQAKSDTTPAARRQ